MKLTKTKIPKGSSLYPNRTSYDYSDSYEFTLNDFKNRLGILDVGKNFVKPGPKWFEMFFTLRNKIASILNLKTPKNSDSKDLIESYKWEIGEQVGIFKVFDRTTDEIILGEDDTHLNFRVSLLLARDWNNRSEKIITVTTIVVYNSWVGRLYFFVVKPFHRTFIPIILKRDYKKLELEINS